MKINILALLLLTPFSVYATDKGHHEDEHSQSYPSSIALSGAYSGSSAASYSDSNAGALAAGGAGGSGGSGGTGNGTASIRGINASSTFNQVRQTPFAYAPTVSLGVNPYKCKDSVSLGGAFSGAALSGGFPVDDGVCEMLVLADYLKSLGFPVEACEMVMEDERIAKVFKKTGKSCSALVAVQTPSIIDLSVYDKMDAVADAQLKALAQRGR